MTEERKDPNLPEDEVLENTPDSKVEQDVPELELEDVSWEIEGDSQEPAGEASPPFQPEEPVYDAGQAGYEQAEPSEEYLEQDAGQYDEPEPEAPVLEEPVYEPEPEPEIVYEAEPEPVQESEPELVDEDYTEPEADYTAEWGWRTQRSGFTPFVFELHGQKHLFSSRGIELIDAVEGIGSYFKYLVDYADSTGMGILTLNTEAKYAEVLARKQLEESGELSTDGILHVFSKRKMEGGQINVFYEIFPREKHIGISESYSTYSHGFVILDTVSLLLGLLKKAGSGAHVLALHVPGAIIMVAGKNGIVHLSRRYTLMGDDAEALVEGIFALQQDIVALEKNLSQKISQIDWIEGLTWTLNLPRPDVEIPLVPYPVHQLTLDGEQVWSALPDALQGASMAAVIGPKEETWLRPLELAEKYVWAAMLAVALVAFFGYFYIDGIKGEVQARSASLKNDINAREAQIKARAGTLAFEDVSSAVQTSTNVKIAALSPPFGEMWNFISALRPEYIRVDGLEYAYQNDGVLVRLEGQVEMDITGAQYGFVRFINSLEAEGFMIQSQQIDLGLEGNYYSLNALWPLKKKGD